VNISKALGFFLLVLSVWDGLGMGLMTLVQGKDLKNLTESYSDSITNRDHTEVLLHK
jgi:hypothetical protein